MSAFVDFFRARLMRLTGRTEKLAYVYLETHGACTNNCYMCPARAGSKPRYVMSDDLLESILTELGEHGFDGELHLYGQNEPLLDNRLFDRIDLASKLVPKARLILISNFSRMTDEQKARLLAAPLNRLTVSLYAADRETYKDVCGSDHFEAVMRNAARFSLAWAETMPYGLSMDILQTNELGDAEKAIHLLDRFPISWWKLPPVYSLRDVIKPGRPKAWNFGQCLFSTLKITGRGDMSPCGIDPDSELHLGNARDGVYKGVNSRKARRLRRSLFFSSGKGHPSFCRTCDYSRDNKLLYFILPEGVRASVVGKLNHSDGGRHHEVFRRNSSDEIRQRARALRGDAEKHGDPLFRGNMEWLLQ
ncbi:Cyclic pyranopterin monophosphate synthase [Pseudodesulfovibrio hydrargyri]|uniref:Cyclic pyranopterin monophosphate synthase n=1 Tax=Pseudodesulfovibrio hydrargyri TaxID=2125990 RepID=A0A1J5MW79_9BACT|nr:radical SAM protein [Pseudodesulfovibrio hydrargyri]OIQ50060.1 Cyclic pyranopterin monophosphate synthase [Pseudodesulfovibrio hydrargyri]